MSVNTLKTIEVVNKLFGKTYEEAINQFGLTTELLDDQYKKLYPFGVHVRASTDGVTVSIGFKDYTMFIEFSLYYYPSYCGSRLFHTFKVDPRVTQEQLDEIMKTFIEENRYDNWATTSSQFLGRSNRIEVIMVEPRAEIRSGNRDPLQDVQPVENPKIVYQPFWNFFHKYAKRVRTRLEVNSNTGNVLHNMEVIL